jgi:hypothetical protein
MQGLFADDETIAKRLMSQDFVGQFKTKKPLVVSDLDEVMVFSLFKAIMLAAHHGDIPQEFSDVQRYISRDSYDFYKWTGNSGWFETHYGDGYYDDLEPSPYGAALAALSRDESIELVIISHTTEETRESKKRFVERFWPKARLFDPPLSKKKSEVINENNLRLFTTFSDDRMDVIEDVVANSALLGQEFIIPRFGHNSEPTKELLTALHNANHKLVYYDKLL